VLSFFSVCQVRPGYGGRTVAGVIVRSVLPFTMLTLTAASCGAGAGTVNTAEVLLPTRRRSCVPAGKDPGKDTWIELLAAIRGTEIGRASCRETGQSSFWGI